MGTSFVRIGERGFWMRDSVLELWLRLLALHLPEPADDERATSPVFRIRDRWLLQSRGYFNGCVTPDLDDAVAEPNGREVVVAAIHSLLHTLEPGDHALDAKTLNLLGIEADWSDDFPAANLVEVGKAFLELIEGRITATAASTAFMPGGHRSRKP